MKQAIRAGAVAAHIAAAKAAPKDASTPCRSGFSRDRTPRSHAIAPPVRYPARTDQTFPNTGNRILAHCLALLSCLALPAFAAPARSLSVRRNVTSATSRAPRAYPFVSSSPNASA